MADTVVSLLLDFPLVNTTTHEPSGSEATQGMAVTSMQSQSTPTTGASRLWSLDPVLAAWTEVPFTANVGVGDAIAGDQASATVDGDASSASGHPVPVSVMSMPDAVVFPRGVPAATGRAGLSTDQPNAGQINQPAFIWTNNLDPVFVYPRANGILEYEPLTNTLGVGGNLCDFRCVSLEVFADRVNFLNTYEAGVRHRNRLRRTARGTADPNPALVGAGFIDLDNFAGHGVKLRRLGNVMACYFQDGAAIVSETGQAAAPYSVQNLDERRGLLGTHALVSISKNEHFGVFDDGWWILDSGGRWREAGVVSFENQPVYKWKSFFYTNFNRAVGHRLQLHYDSEHHWVRMAVPDLGNDSRVSEVWIYDIAADRVWKDRYTGGVSCWGDITVRTDTPLTWATAIEAWSTQPGTWQSFEAIPGQQQLSHGTELGFVYWHSDDLDTRDGSQPTWSYEVLPADFGRELSSKTAHRLSMEHVAVDNPTSATLAVTTGSGTSSSKLTSLDVGSPGNTVRSQTHHHITDEHLGFLTSGTGRVKIRSFTLDYSEDQTERVPPR